MNKKPKTTRQSRTYRNTSCYEQCSYISTLLRKYDTSLDASNIDVEKIPFCRALYVIFIGIANKEHVNNVEQFKSRENNMEIKKAVSTCLFCKGNNVPCIYVLDLLTSKMQYLIRI